jgi:hypothetical protein
MKIKNYYSKKKCYIRQVRTIYPSVFSKNKLDETMRGITWKKRVGLR